MEKTPVFVLKERKVIREIKVTKAIKVKMVLSPIISNNITNS